MFSTMPPALPSASSPPQVAASTTLGEFLIRQDKSGPWVPSGSHQTGKTTITREIKLLQE